MIGEAYGRIKMVRTTTHSRSPEKWLKRVKIVEYLLGGRAFFRLVLQHPFDDLLGGRGDVLGHTEFASSDSMKQLFVGFTYENYFK